MQIKYIFLSAENYAVAADISEGEIRDYYDSHRDAFKKKGGERASLAEVRGKIVSALRQSKALDVAHAEAKKARTIIYQEENFDEYARKHNIAVHAAEITMKAGLPRELASIKELEQYLAALKADQITPILSTPTGYAIIKLISRKDSRIPKLAEIRNEVERHYVNEEAQKLCQKEAEEILDRLKKGAGMSEMAREKGLQVAETGYFSPGVTISKIGTSREIGQAVYQLSAKKPYPDRPFLVDGQYVIIRFKDRKLEAKDFAAKKEGLKHYLARQKENLYLQSWIAESKEALMKSGKIKIYEDASKL